MGTNSIELSVEHIARINSMNLGLHIDHAAYQILIMMKNSHDGLLMGIDEAVERFCLKKISEQQVQYYRPSSLVVNRYNA